MKNMFSIKRRGFTLAEVLVTLGIIGVVAAMTMPTLMGHYQKQSLTTQMHKVYTEVSQAALNVIRESNAISLRESNFQRRGAAWFLTNYFKTVQTCTDTNLANCLAPSYRNINGGDYNSGISNDTRCAVLASGATICFTGTNALVDVNSKAGPNVYGRDLFTFTLGNDGAITVVEGTFDDDCKGATANTTGACLSRILTDGWKMNY